MDQLFTIGKLAKKAGVSIDGIRFYERRGLLAPPARTKSNYRLYPADAASRLRFIKKAQKLGFSLNDIEELLALSHDPTASQADIKHKTEEKIEDIRNRIQDLSRVLQALEQLNECCDGHGSVGECPILKALAKEDSLDNPHQPKKG